MSAPTIVTTHNKPAEISVGESRPFIESMVSDSNSGGGTKNNVNYKDVGLTLKVKPLIGNNGIIQMEIEQTVDKNIEVVNVGGMEQPVISKKHATSFVSVADMDVVVLAGLQEKNYDNSGGKIWLLGDLPLVGDLLFTSRTREEITTELIIFIKPTIILQPQDEAGYLEKRLEAANMKPDLEYYNNKGKFMDGEPFPNDTLFGLQLAEMKKRELEQERVREEQFAQYGDDPKSEVGKGREWRAFRKKKLAEEKKNAVVNEVEHPEDYAVRNRRRASRN
jgi:Flp pilus assembly secretin CpaC